MAKRKTTPKTAETKPTPEAAANAIRVLHFADVHIGMENYGRTDGETGLSSRVVDFLRRMEEMIDYARENDVDLIIFAGDAFKTRAPSPTYQREFAWRIRDLAELAPVVMLVGNHDLPPNAVKASSIEIYDTLDVPNVRVAQEYTVFKMETKRGPVIIGTAPYPMRARMLQHIRSSQKTIREVDDLLEEQLNHILEDLAVQADELDPDNEIPRLLTGHFTVRGAILGSERSVMLGRDVQVSIGLLADPRWDYVAMGHIHKWQDLTLDREDAPPVVYSGSLERIDFGEEGDDKGYMWVSLARNATVYERKAVTARPMMTLRIDCRTDKLPTQTVLREIKKFDLNEAIVRIHVQLTPQTDALLNDARIREALREAGTFHIAGIRRDVERAYRTRLDSNPEQLTHEQLLEQYLHMRDMDPAYRNEIIEAGNKIIHDEAD
ncbi:exonuclease SbcCD subunit D [Phototrophicus methaneseepsis]|uniref:Nuclease SbcCD subunit D n=1 Tax=Phototrophicus methaneseepsis TaxID=2710758 RepID=A0A7S8IES8_9CHLR|nr:exonuclease SbcCD subunit D [Phototrophicus methaneseepsis]QPC82906.1 exonuclease SbcCD subunit D [Phototrophicus methaneseepsis]